MNPDSRESERRQATILFADIAGFTSMSEHMDAEDVTSLMNAVFQMMGDIVAEHGGSIDKFIGDCVMALFGVPRAIEDAPGRAVRAAAKMRSQLQKFNTENQTTLGVHIGINTGEVIAGRIGSTQKQEYTVMGDAVNLASRLENTSEAGQILVGPSTHRLTRSLFEYRGLEPVAVKGKEQQIPVFELLSTAPIESQDRDSGRSLKSAIVGRESEIDRLHLHLLKVVNSEGSVVSVVGEAGVGKSRLVAELKSFPEISKVRLVEGRAVSVGMNLGHHVFIDILRTQARISENDSPSTAIAKLSSTISEVARDRADEILPFIGLLAGVELDGEHAERIKRIDEAGLRQQMLKHFKDLLLAMSKQKPVVLVIDDLHWADSSSVDVLVSLLSLVREMPLLVVALFRPNFPDTSDRILQATTSLGTGLHCELRLRPLDPAAAESLLKNLLSVREVPARIRTQVIARSEGNPFYIEEVIRSLIDSGAITPVNGKYTFSSDAELVNIPHGVQEIVMARIDRLEEQTRNILRYAAVIGRSFLLRILETITDDVTDLEDRLGYLRRMEIIGERQGSDDAEFFFRNALTQEAVYQSLLVQTRRELHLAVARAIEKIYESRLSDYFGMLAYHYVRGADSAKAEEYLVKAGEAALQSAAPAEALYFYHEALERYMTEAGDGGDPRRLAKLEQNIGDAYVRRGHHSEAAHHFERALAHYGVGVQDNSLFQVFTGYVFPLMRFISPWKWRRNPSEPEREIIDLLTTLCFSFSMVNPSKANRYGTLAFQRMMGINLHQIPRAKTVLYASTGMYTAGRMIEAGKAYSERIWKIVDGNEPKDVFQFHFSNSLFAYAAGDYRLTYHGALVDTMVGEGELQAVACYLFWHARIALERGDLAFFDELINKLDSAASEYGNEECALQKHMVYALFLYYTGAADAADEIDRAIVSCDRVGLTMMKVLSLSYKAQIAVDSDDQETANTALEQIDAICSSQAESYAFVDAGCFEAKVVHDLWRLEHGSGSPSVLAKECAKSIARVRKLARYHPPLRPAAGRLAGTFHWLQNRRTAAFGEWRKSIQAAEALEAGMQLGRTWREIANRVGPGVDDVPGDLSGASDKADAILCSLGIEMRN